MSSTDNNRMILNYHDAVLYPSDLVILKSQDQWLNDACLHFHLTRLDQKFQHSHQKQQDQAATHTSAKFRFVDPSVLSFFMHQWEPEEDNDGGGEDVLGIQPQQHLTEASSNRRCYTYCFLPINDNYLPGSNWTTPGGGTHWSLLLLVLLHPTATTTTTTTTSTTSAFAHIQVRFFHFDSSSRSSNRRAAVAVATKIQQMMATWTNSNSNASSCTPVVVQECRVPQQTNGYDCGIHTLATAEAIAQSISISARSLPSSAAAAAANNHTNNVQLDVCDAHPTTKDELEKIVMASVATIPSFCLDMRQRIAKDIMMLAIATHEII